MYYRHRWEKLDQQVQRLLSHKRRTFSLIFFAFLKSTQNFAHFENKDKLHSLNISEVIIPDKCGYFNRFTADRMYSRHRWEKSPQQVQILLS